jgi:hypothetical protein
MVVNAPPIARLQVAEEGIPPDYWEFNGVSLAK